MYRTIFRRLPFFLFQSSPEVLTLLTYHYKQLCLNFTQMASHTAVFNVFPLLLIIMSVWFIHAVVWRQFFLFIFQAVLHSMTMSQFISPFHLSWHLGCFQFQANKISLLWTFLKCLMHWFLLHIYLMLELLGNWIVMFLTLVDTTKSFLKWLYYFSHIPAVSILSCLTSLEKLCNS